MERQKMKKKGFTLVELLVVIAIIAMLLAILMPALGKVRQLAQRIMCGTNLSGLGKAMLTYCTDDKYENYPVSGSPGAYWNRGSGSGTGALSGTCSWDWRNPGAFPEPVAGNKWVTLSSCLYLLVRVTDVAPDQFICPGSEHKKFDMTKYDTTTYVSSTYVDVWDFGSRIAPGAEKATGLRGKGHNSYSYQLPLPIVSGGPTSYPVSSTTNPAKAVIADRSPYWTQPVDKSYLYAYDCTANKVKSDSIPAGNNPFHQKDGQSVIYADQHSKFESANCGIEMDNIYTVWGKPQLDASSCPDEAAKQCGLNGGTNPVAITGITTLATWYPQNTNDNYLVSDIDN